MKNSTLNKLFFYSILSFLSFTAVSCEDDNVGDFLLEGNIEHLIPSGSYDLGELTSRNNKYIVFTPTLDPNFDYWGLTLERVDYYLDGSLYKTFDEAPFDLLIDRRTLKEGNYNLEARMLVKGKHCDDLYLSCRTSFIISHNNIQEVERADFFMDINYVTQGDYLKIVPEFLPERSPKGTIIDKVEYYWDGNLIATAKTAPFSLKYKVNDAIGSKHDIRASISYHDNTHKSMHYDWNFSGYKVLEKDAMSVLWRKKGFRNDYVNGETLSLSAISFKGEGVKKQYEIQFYLDGILIGKSSVFPYNLDYLLDGIPVGAHTIVVKTIFYEKNSSTSYTQTEKIIITQ